MNKESNNRLDEVGQLMTYMKKIAHLDHGEEPFDLVKIGIVLAVSFD